jgi:hypothetical protein
MTEKKDLEAVEKLNEARNKIKKEIKKVIIGQDRVIDELLTALLSSGHCLLIGVPGLAKTLMISTISRILDLKFNRIQFTPDLMPSDITGTEIIEDNVSTGERSFKFVKGPVFANIVLADEINRTPPKTQAALLQAMQEHEVTAGGETYKLVEPFFVLATQNLPPSRSPTGPVHVQYLCRLPIGAGGEHHSQIHHQCLWLGFRKGDGCPGDHSVATSRPTCTGVGSRGRLCSKTCSQHQTTWKQLPSLHKKLGNLGGGTEGFSVYDSWRENQGNIGRQIYPFDGRRQSGSKTGFKTSHRYLL